MSLISKRFGLVPVLAAILTVLAAWMIFDQNRVSFSSRDTAIIASMSLSKLGPLPADPSNRYADDERAAKLGEALFSDTNLSRSSQIACASCHQPQTHFDDNALPGEGVGETTRRTMPLAGAAYSPWFFWDGRADSQWAQALGPIEHAGEQAFDRLSVARLITSAYREEYEAIFGPLPDLESLPKSASPIGETAAREAWQALDSESQSALDIVFTNVGKAIAAFERGLMPERGRFDDYADDLAAGKTSEALTTLEQQGLAVFIGRGQCIQCHNGPLMSDHFFHNTGVPFADGLPLDLGRSAALDIVESDPFNCLGRFSDADASQCRELQFMSRDALLLRTFKTPSLRAIGARAPYMHAGQFSNLTDVVAHYNAAPWALIGVSELTSLELTPEEQVALLAFLKAL